MPRPIKSARAKPSSDSPADPPPKAAPPGPQFTESSQPNPPNEPDRPDKAPDSAEWLSLDATEPFPPGLFRLPVPNKVFDRMPSVSDSALRCLLALIHQSFRFDPAESKWVHTGDWFNRSDVENECGLSSQGTRNGLGELEEIGWVRADRDGRGFRYQLLSEVPEKRFTYLPTALLEELSSLGSTELRVVLAVLRRTWGWTETKQKPEGGEETVHVRWTQASNGDLGEITGRSKSAVKTAAKALQGEWIERIRPGSGAYQYRFLPEAVGNGSGEPDSFCTGTSNDLLPDRQKSAPPSFSKENRSKDKHSQISKTNDPEPKTEPPTDEESAVPSTKQSQGRPEAEEDRTRPEKSGDQSPTADLSNLPSEKRDLAEKLQNVGVWAGRIAELLSRFSRGRIEANFELYRQRAAEQTIHKPGAWLNQAITEGYALPSPDSETPDSETPDPESIGGSLPPLEHQETVSEEKKDVYVAQGVGEDRFHRCPSRQAGPEERRFMYFAPGEGGPTRRV
jgi:hypothetical protein